MTLACVKLTGKLASITSNRDIEINHSVVGWGSLKAAASPFKG